MAYLHCHSCDFTQDDYWSKNGWNPVKSFQNDLSDLIDGDLDEVLIMDKWWLDENGYAQEEFTRRKMILHHLKQIECSIKNMVYRTPQELEKKNPERICPKCGKKDLDED